MKRYLDKQFCGLIQTESSVPSVDPVTFSTVCLFSIGHEILFRRLVVKNL